MLASGSKCKVCGKWANYETSELSKDLPELDTNFYCSIACRDYDNWGSKTIRGSWLVILGWIFILAAESDVLIGLIGIPTFVLGVFYMFRGYSARKRWSLTPEEEIEINEFTDELWDEGIDDVSEINQ